MGGREERVLPEAAALIFKQGCVVGFRGGGERLCRRGGAGGRPRFHLPSCSVRARPPPSSLRGAGASRQPPASSRCPTGPAGGRRGSRRGSGVGHSAVLTLRPPPRLLPGPFLPRRDEGSARACVCVHEGYYLMSVLALAMHRGAGGPCLCSVPRLELGKQQARGKTGVKVGQKTPRGGSDTRGRP